MNIKEFHKELKEIKEQGTRKGSKEDYISFNKRKNDRRKEYFSDLLKTFKKLSIEDQLLYDFTTGYNDEYDNIDNSIKRFLIYKAKNNFTEYKGLIDPDSNSHLLQSIYDKLWNYNEWHTDKKKYMIDTEKNFTKADTMTSGITPLCQYLKLQDDKKKWNTENCVKEMEQIEQIITDTDNNKNAKFVYNFIKLNHTLGNFIPVPKGFNVARAWGYAKHDNWFLTMTQIKDFYENKETINIDHPLIKLLSYDAIVNTYNWLNDYNTINDFIENNYLQDYNKEIENFNWENCEINEKNVNDFFKTMTEVILNRSLRMIIKLNSYDKIGIDSENKEIIKKVFEDFGVSISEDIKKDFDL